MSGELTRFGFTMGALEVTRVCLLPDRGADPDDLSRAVIEMKTPHRSLTIYASRTGRSLRVFEDNHSELLVPDEPSSVEAA